MNASPSALCDAATVPLKPRTSPVPAPASTAASQQAQQEQVKVGRVSSHNYGDKGWCVVKPAGRQEETGAPATMHERRSWREMQQSRRLHDLACGTSATLARSRIDDPHKL